MINQKVVDLVEEKLKEGLSNEELEKELLIKNYSQKDIRKIFNVISNGGVLNNGIKIIFFIQVIIVLFNIILIGSVKTSCVGVGEFCGLEVIFILIPSIIIFIIISTIGYNSANDKIKIYKLKNQKVPVFIKLFALPSKVGLIFFIFLIIFIFLRLFINL